MNREVLTLQFGSYSNFVGAHFWNNQDEYFGSAAGQDDATAVLNWRATHCSGKTASGVDYFCPRLMLVDVPEALGGMRSTGLLYLPRGATADEDELGHTAQSWGGGVSRHDQGPNAPSALSSFLTTTHEDQEADYAEAFASLDFGGGAAVSAPAPAPEEEEEEEVDLGLDNSVALWSDALKAGLHHRSVRTVASGQGVGAGVAWADSAAGAVLRGGVDTAAAGEALWEGMRNSEEGEELADTFRHWLEASDALSGIHVLADADCGWGGFAGGFLQDVVRSECPKAPIMAFPVVQPWDPRACGAASQYTAMSAAADPASSRSASVGASAGDLSALRDMSVALSTSALLGCCDTVVPLGLEALSALASVRRSVLGGGGPGAGYSKLALGATTGVDGWFPALGGDIPLFNPYASSALLAAGLDMATLPHRTSRTGPGGGGAKPDLRMLSTPGVAAATGDAREGSRDTEGKRSLIPALPPGGSLRDTLGVLGPSAAHRMAAVSVALPFPHPAAQPEGLAARLKAGPGLGTVDGAGGFTFLSSAAVGSSRRAAALPQGAGGGPTWGEPVTPAGQYLTLRGELGGQPGMDAALQGALASHGGMRAGTRAAVCSVGTPLPLPITTPRSLFTRTAQGEGLTVTEAKPLLTYTPDGGVVATVGGRAERVVYGRGWGPGDREPAREGVSWEQDPLSLDAASSSLPYSLCVLAHTSTSPALEGPVRAMAQAADRGSVGQHATAASAAAKAGGRFAADGAELSEAAEALHAAADVLAAGHTMGAPSFGGMDDFGDDE